MNLLFSLCICVILYVTCGQINGDPAPGRSPGPPAVDVLQSQDAIYSDDNNKLTNSTDKSSIVLSKQTTVRLNINRTAENLSNNDVLPDGMDDHEAKVRFSYEGKTFSDIIDNVSDTTAKLNSLPPQNSSKFNDNIQRCNNARNYILSTDKIIKVAVDSNDALHSSHKRTVPIRIDVTHDLFDTHDGLVNKIVYIGELNLCILIIIIKSCIPQII